MGRIQHYSLPHFFPPYHDHYPPIISLQAGSYNADAVSTDLNELDNVIPMNTPAGVALQVLVDVNQELGRVFHEISTKASLADLSGVLSVASLVELARYLTFMLHKPHDVHVLTSSYTHSHALPYTYMFAPPHTHTPSSPRHSLTRHTILTHSLSSYLFIHTCTYMYIFPTPDIGRWLPT